MKPLSPIPVQHLFRILDAKLLELLESLSPADWENPTVAKHWRVKDVVAHLLDGNLRTLSIQRDRYFGEAPPALTGYHDLVSWLNKLNADWVNASKRISPEVLLLLHQATGTATTAYYESLDLNAPAIFPVAWAGETESLNWMHLAREYTEKWHHQQQIREATNQPGIMTPELYYPFIDTFMRALPYTFRATAAPVGTGITVTVSSEMGGSWHLQKQTENWELVPAMGLGTPVATVAIPPEIAWKLFSKSVRPDTVLQTVQLTGNQELGRQVLEMVSVMA